MDEKVRGDQATAVYPADISSADLSGAAQRPCGPKVLVVIPTYNEQENVEKLIELVLSQPVDVEVLVVDDDSPDGTGELAEAIAAREPRVHVIRRPGKMGLGSAYVDGFSYALKNTQADLVLQMDADFSHDPDAIPAFLMAAEENDVVLGSRYLKGVTVVNWPLKRLFLSYGANLYTRLITGLSFKDATGGYKCFRREVLAALNLSGIHSDGYSFQIETTYRAWRKGFRIREIPIIFVDRRVGVSKMNRRIVLEAVFLVWRLALTNLFRSRPVEREPRPLLRGAREER